jgi:hypothetical protein
VGRFSRGPSRHGRVLVEALDATCDTKTYVNQGDGKATIVQGSAATLEVRNMLTDRQGWRFTAWRKVADPLPYSIGNYVDDKSAIRVRQNARYHAWYKGQGTFRPLRYEVPAKYEVRERNTG